MNASPTVLGSLYHCAVRAKGDVNSIDLSRKSSFNGGPHGGSGRASQAAYRELWRETATSGRAPLSLAMAKHFGASDAGALGYLMTTAPTMKHALAMLVCFSRVLDDFLVVRVDERPDSICIDLRYLGQSEYPPESIEAAVTILAKILRVCLDDKDWTPIEVQTEHALAAVGQYETFFGCPVRPAHPRNAIVLHRSDLNRVLPGHDPVLHEILQEHAASLIASLPPCGDIREQVERILHQSIGKGAPKVDTVAKNLGVSARTLQRRLAESGENYASLVDRYRETSAMKLLDDERLAIYDVADLLGFSEPKAFRRAFKRWTGKSPRSHRTERRAQTAAQRLHVAEPVRLS